MLHKAQAHCTHSYSARLRQQGKREINTSQNDRYFTTFYREGDNYLNTWWSTDSKTEQQPWKSPYNYMGGNPIWKIDPLGDVDDWVQAKDGSIKYDKDATSPATTKRGNII